MTAIYISCANSGNGLYFPSDLFFNSDSANSNDPIIRIDTRANFSGIRFVNSRLIDDRIGDSDNRGVGYVIHYEPSGIGVSGRFSIRTCTLTYSFDVDYIPSLSEPLYYINVTGAEQASSLVPQLINTGTILYDWDTSASIPLNTNLWTNGIVSGPTPLGMVAHTGNMVGSNYIFNTLIITSGYETKIALGDYIFDPAITGWARDSTYRISYEGGNWKAYSGSTNVAIYGDSTSHIPPISVDRNTTLAAQFSNNTQWQDSAFFEVGGLGAKNFLADIKDAASSGIVCAASTQTPTPPPTPGGQPSQHYVYKTNNQYYVRKSQSNNSFFVYKKPS